MTPPNPYAVIGPQEMTPTWRAINNYDVWDVLMKMPYVNNSFINPKQYSAKNVFARTG